MSAPSYLGERDLEVGAGLLVDLEGLLEGRELDRRTLEPLKERVLDRPTLERLEDRLLGRLTLDRDLELLEGRLDRTEGELGLLDVRTRLLLRETLEPRE